MRDIIAQHKTNEGSSGQGSGTESDCDTAGSSAGQQVTLYFMLMKPSGEIADGSSPATYQTKYDLLGPSPPTGLSAGVGENRLIVSWDNIPVADDLYGYKIYCDPKPGALAPASTPMATDGGADASITDGGTEGAAGAGGAAGGTGTGGAAGATGTGGAAGAAGSTSTGNPDCPSTALIAGERPDSAYECGSATGRLASDVTAKDLVNGTSYAVAVAATDTVGNSGVLSEVVCGSPQPVDDFYELYRRAGGKGGGGFCSITHGQQSGLLVLLFAPLFALGLRRWRRRR